MRRWLLALLVAALAAPGAVRADPDPSERARSTPDGVAVAPEPASEPASGGPTGEPTASAPRSDASGESAPSDEPAGDDARAHGADARPTRHDGSTAAGMTPAPRAHRARRTAPGDAFSDGPRRVPTPRGASLARATELGLGGRECASSLLSEPPDARWVEAAGGRAPRRLLWPVDEGRFGRGFGYVRATLPDVLHRGIDVVATEGSVVRAVADGIVAYADNGVHGYGNLVLVVHGNGWVSLYAHNSRVTVQPGYRVRRGERIALVGATGIAHGPHVHFELLARGRPIDPAALFDGGPAFVTRLAARAAEHGEVPPPEPVTAEDRPVEPPLAAFEDAPDDPPAPRLAAAAPASADTPRAPAPTSPAPPTDPGPALGSLALARHLLAHPASEALLATVAGEIFPTLLFPVRDGAVARPHGGSRRPMELSGEPDAAVRAAADGRVVFVGELPEVGPTIVLLHRNGWATFYERVTPAVELGAQVARGAWIGHSDGRTLRFELRVGGVPRDPAEVLVHPRTRATE